MHDDDELDEPASVDFEAVVGRFYALPEGEAMLRASDGIGWAGLLLSYALSEHRIRLVDMTPRHLHSLLFDVFPKRAPLGPQHAQSVIVELRALFRFAERELEMRHARACLALVEATDAEARLEAALADRSRWTATKTRIMDDPSQSDNRSTREDLDL